MKPLISLVIPVYNVEKYFVRCMESVLRQTYDYFEVILVDDGSTDNSGKMCDEYAEKDNRVAVYHKLNGGLSDARNFGVERANAEWVSFIDSDDYVTEDYLEYLWYLIEKYDADLSVGQFIRISDCQIGVEIEQQNVKDYCLDTENAMKDLCLGNYISTVSWGKLYRKEYLYKNKFPIGKYYEDIATTYKLFFESKKVAVGLKKIYFYVQRNISILHSTVNDKLMYGLIAAENMCDFICSNFPTLNSIAHVRCCTTAIDIIIRVVDNVGSERKYYDIAKKYLNKHYSFIKHSKFTRFIYKMDCINYAAGFNYAKMYYTVRNCFAKIIKGDMIK